MRQRLAASDYTIHEADAEILLMVSSLSSYFESRYSLDDDSKVFIIS